MSVSNILGKLRYILDYNDSKMKAIFSNAGAAVNEDQIGNWLRKESDSLFEEIDDENLALFLDGLITEKRGKKDGPTRPPEKQLSNNMIMQKLKIAFSMQAEDVLEVMKAGGFPISKNELSSFFRRTDHKHYRPCLDQYLRAFLKGLQETKRT